MVQFIHQVGLADRFHFLLLAHAVEIDLLEHVDCRVLPSDNAINDTKGPLSQFLFKLEFTQPICHFQ